MLMAMMVRPPLEADLTALTEIDSSYAKLHGLEPLLSEGALRFFGRTEHSFVAHPGQGAGAVGFVMAQAIWSGERPQVLVARIATDGTPGAAGALVKALVKSAYDSGVYDLLCRSAEERYRVFLAQEPALADRLTQSDIARYLGITAIALSRIRRRLAG